MRSLPAIHVLCALTCLTCACTTIPTAPGAEKVRFTKIPADVAACTAVGNVKVPADLPYPIDNAEIEARNLTIGLGGNVLLVTVDGFTAPSQGIAYRCP